MTQEIRDLLTQIYHASVETFRGRHNQSAVEAHTLTIQSLIGEAVEKLDKMGWKPIGSADKGGRFLFTDGDIVSTGEWVDTSYNEEKFIRKAKDGDVYKTVRVEDGFWNCNDELYGPTHWMYLPSPPEATNATSE